MKKKLKRFSLKNKIAVVTGGNGFFGKQICNSLIANVCNVISLDLKIEKTLLKKNYFQYICDISKEEEIREINRCILKKFKKIDILVNNAALDFKPKKGSKSEYFDQFDLRRWDDEVAVGLTGSFLCSKYFIKNMIKNKNGIILNIASDLSLIAPDQRIYSHLKSHKPVSYSVIKHGIVGLTKYLAATFAHKNIRVNSISPGGIEQKGLNKKFKKKLINLIPLNRMAKNDEYIETIQFLCSDASSYITGQNIVLDGGRSII